MGFFQLGLRRAAARLSRMPATCGPCLRGQLQAQVKAAQVHVPPSRLIQLVRASRSFATTPAVGSKAPLESSSASVAQSAQGTPQTPPSQAAGESSGESSSSFPKTNAKVVGYWLIGSAVSVFGIVVWGGLTRLTESGYVVTQTVGF